MSVSEMTVSPTATGGVSVIGAFEEQLPVALRQVIC